MIQIPEITDFNDEEILKVTDLPPGIEAETLYWFDITCNSTNPIGSLKIGSIQEIVLRDKLKIEQFYRFVV